MIDTKGRNEVVMSGYRVELCIRVCRRPTEGHVTTILRKENSVSRFSLDSARPFQLPHCEISISMEGEQHTLGGSRISNDKSHQLLSVGGVVVHTPGFERRLIESWWLKENSLLGPPEKEEKAEQQPED